MLLNMRTKAYKVVYPRLIAGYVSTPNVFQKALMLYSMRDDPSACVLFQVIVRAFCSGK